MIDIKKPETFKKLDPRNTVGTTEIMAQQFKAAWEQVTSLKLAKIEGIQNIVFCGMGASIYGALCLRALMGRTLPLPMEVVSDYYLPDYAGEHTLVVLTSYSGTTEEVLSCANDAKAKEAKMIVLTKGGPLEEFAKDNNLPAYIFDGKLNLAGSPRLGAGYTILGLIGLLSKLEIISLEEQEMTNAITRIAEKIGDIKQQAQADCPLFLKNIPIIFAAEHLAGNAQIIRNQFNETSKAFSSYFLIPDLNHHLMEGLQFPKKAPLYFFIFNSPNYSDKIIKRISLTVEIIRNHNYPVLEFMTSGQTVYDDFLEALQYGSFLTLYLGLLHNQNPAINPYVDWFKEKLTS
jgi:glucose/mannose-6-phosphate isomerase